MADEQKDTSKFNMNTLFKLNNKEKDKVLTIGAYNGNVQLTVGPAQFERGRAPRSTSLTPHMAYLIAEMIKKIIDKPMPNEKTTLTFNGIWNNETRKRELSLTVTIGMDEQAMCFIGVKHVDRTTREVFSGRFELTGDRNIEVSGLYDDDKSRSLMQLKSLYHLFDKGLFETGAFFTRNHLVQPNFNRNNNNSSSNNSSAPADDDF